MHKVFHLLVIAGLLPICAAHADVLALPGSASAAMQVPTRGANQADVTRRFGEPMRRHAPVGGGNPQHPPITRWDYDGWSVFYENNIVIDVVIEDAPAPVHNVEMLQPTP